MIRELAVGAGEETPEPQSEQIGAMLSERATLVRLLRCSAKAGQRTAELLNAKLVLA